MNVLCAQQVGADVFYVGPCGRILRDVDSQPLVGAAASADYVQVLGSIVNLPLIARLSTHAEVTTVVGCPEIEVAVSTPEFPLWLFSPTLASRRPGKWNAVKPPDALHYRWLVSHETSLPEAHPLAACGRLLEVNPVLLKQVLLELREPRWFSAANNPLNCAKLFRYFGLDRRRQRSRGDGPAMKRKELIDALRTTVRRRSLWHAKYPETCSGKLLACRQLLQYIQWVWLAGLKAARCSKSFSYPDYMAEQAKSLLQVEG